MTGTRFVRGSTVERADGAPRELRNIIVQCIQCGEKTKEKNHFISQTAVSGSMRVTIHTVRTRRHYSNPKTRHSPVEHTKQPDKTVKLVRRNETGM